MRDRCNYVYSDVSGNHFMKSVIILILFTIPLVSSGQVDNSIPRIDSAGLHSFAKKFRNAISQRNKTAIRQMSLKVIHCPICIDEPFVNDVPIDTFINQLIKNRFIRLEVASREQSPIYRAYENYKGQELAGNETVTVHQLFYSTIKRNELGYSHEGQQIAFRFVKINDEFKFCGLESIP